MVLCRNMKYNTEGQTILKTNYSNLDTEVPVGVITNLIPDLILVHDFLEKNGVTLDYACHVIFIGKDSHVRIIRYNGNCWKKTLLLFQKKSNQICV